MAAAVPRRSKVAVSLSRRLPDTGPLAFWPNCNTPACIAKSPSMALALLRRSVPLPNLVKVLAVTEPARVATPLV